MRYNGKPGAAPTAYGRSVSAGVYDDEHPRHRLLHGGPETLSNAELLAVLFRTGHPGSSALDSAQDLLRQIGGLIGLMNADESVQLLRGVGRGKASTLLAAVELGRRLAKARFHERDVLNEPAIVADYLALRYSTLDQEILGALYLNARNHLIAEREVYRGTLSRMVVEPRVIIKEALLRSACSMILFHTHPSGDPNPSMEDLEFTRRMLEAGKLLNIRLLDHLILGAHGRWVSLARRGAF
jgi:DNA repair protein RadC